MAAEGERDQKELKGHAIDSGIYYQLGVVSGWFCFSQPFLLNYHKEAKSSTNLNTSLIGSAVFSVCRHPINQSSAGKAFHPRGPALVLMGTRQSPQGAYGPDCSQGKSSAANLYFYATVVVTASDKEECSSPKTIPADWLLWLLPNIFRHIQSFN